MPELVFMGTSDSKGVPRYYCTCKVCEQARTTGQNRRTRSSLLIQGAQNTLIDAGPDFHAQSTREKLTEIHTLLVTHAHNDHILGLGDLLDFVTYARGHLPMYAPLEVVPMVKSRFAYLDRLEWLKPLPGGLVLEGYQVQAFKVPHGANGFSYAYRFDSLNFAWVYCPDSINISPETEEEFMLDLDLLILGTSFWKEPYPMQTRSVYDVQEALELKSVQTAKKVILTHMSHDIDAEVAVLPEHVSLAFDGMRVWVP